MNIKCVNVKSQESDINTCSYKLNLTKNTFSSNEKTTIEKISFNVNETVKHKLENIFGVITFICDDYTSIKWQDNSKEKFTQNEMNKYIEKVSEKDMPVIEDKKAELDIEKINMKRQLDLLNKDKKDKLVEKVKKYAAQEIVELAISKNIIDEDDRDIEIEMVSMMNEEDYDNYCKNVLEFSNEHEVTSRVEDKDDRTEAEKMLDKVKNTGGIIGDFNNKTASSISSHNDSSRNLRGISPNNVTIGEGFKMPTFEDQFTDILSKNVKIAENKSVPKEKGVFDNIQGLSKPIQIPSDQVNVGNNFSELFNSLNWSM